MAIQSLILNLFYFISILTASTAEEVNIQLYKHYNFTGLLWESNATAECTNIPKIENANVYSIRTDTCFIAYHDPDCKSRWSMKYMPGDINLSEYDIGRDGRIRSFHTCTEDEGGSQLNVDITKYYTFSYLSSFVPDVLQSYKNVCSCVNVTQCVQNMDSWSINNHHNSLLVYYEPDCTANKWDFKLIPAGHSMDSRYMHDHIQTDSLTKTTSKIQSFGPNPNSLYYQKSCKAAHFTTESSKLVLDDYTENYETTKGTELVDISTDVIQTLTNKVRELEMQVDQSRQNIDNFENIMEAISKRQKDEFIKFTDKIEKYLKNFEKLVAQLNLTCTICMKNEI